MESSDQAPLLKHVSQVITTLTFVAALITALTSLRDFITPMVTYVGTALVILFVVLSYWYLRRYGLIWSKADGSKEVLRRIDTRIILPLIGVLLSLWIPRFLPPAEASQTVIVGPVEVVTPIAPTPLPTPLPMQPARDGETLILVTTFYRTTEDSTDAHNKIRRSIEEAIGDLALENTRVEVEPNISFEEDQEEAARELAERYNAAMIIWGTETSVDVVVNFLNVRSPEERLADERIPVLNDPQFARAVVFDLPAQLTYLSLYGISQSYIGDSRLVDAHLIIERALAPWETGADLPSESKRMLSPGYFLLGWLEGKEGGDFAAAIAGYNKAVELDPDNSLAYYNRGAAYYEIHSEYELALEDFNRSLELDPNNPKTLVYLGLIYSQLGEHEKELDYYNQAIALDPNYALVYYNRGVTYYETFGEYELALEDFHRASELGLNDPWTNVYLGIIYSQLGEYEKGLDYYNQAIASDPDNSRGHYGRGVAYYEIHGEYELALEDFNRALELDPNDPRPLVYLGMIYSQHGEYEKELDYYDQAIALDPNYALAYYNRGVTYYETHSEYELALEDFHRALELDPNDPYSHNYLGIIYSQLGEYEKGLDHYNQAIALDPNYAHAYFNRGRAYYEIHGEYELAVEDFQRVLELNPNYLNAQTYLDLIADASTPASVSTTGGDPSQLSAVSVSIRDYFVIPDEYFLNERGVFPYCISVAPLVIGAIERIDCFVASGFLVTYHKWENTQVMIEVIEKYRNQFGLIADRQWYAEDENSPEGSYISYLFEGTPFIYWTADKWGLTAEALWPGHTLEEVETWWEDNGSLTNTLH